jgi:hypothetical protein
MKLAMVEDVDCTSSGFLNANASIPGLGRRTVGDFWQWAYSDVMSNRNRSIFAEFMVGVALGVVDRPRVEWDAVDLRYGGYKIEVKSAAYVQSWPQKKPSIIRFDIAKAVFWDAATGESSGEATRCADVYVFCLYPERDKAKANVLDVATWKFYVVPTEILNREFRDAKSVSLASLSRVAVACRFDGLRAAVDAVVAARR